MAKKVIPTRIVYTYDEAMKEMFQGEEIYKLVNDDFERIDSHEDLETYSKEDKFYSCILSDEGFIRALSEDKELTKHYADTMEMSTCSNCGYSWKTEEMAIILVLNILKLNILV